MLHAECRFAAYFEISILQELAASDMSLNGPAADFDTSLARLIYPSGRDFSLSVSVIILVDAARHLPHLHTKCPRLQIRKISNDLKASGCGCRAQHSQRALRNGSRQAVALASMHATILMSRLLEPARCHHDKALRKPVLKCLPAGNCWSLLKP